MAHSGAHGCRVHLPTPGISSGNRWETEVGLPVAAQGRDPCRSEPAALAAPSESVHERMQKPAPPPLSFPLPLLADAAWEPNSLASQAQRIPSATWHPAVGAAAHSPGTLSLPPKTAANNYQSTQTPKASMCFFPMRGKVVLCTCSAGLLKELAPTRMSRITPLIPMWRRVSAPEAVPLAHTASRRTIPCMAAGTRENF